MYKNNTANLASISIFSTLLVFISIAFTGCASTNAVEETSVQVPQSEGQDVAAKTAQVDSVAVALLDDDIDGVVNTDDQCKDTPPNTLVDIKGCALDTDGDKVASDSVAVEVYADPIQDDNQPPQVDAGPDAGLPRLACYRSARWGPQPAPPAAVI